MSSDEEQFRRVWSDLFDYGLNVFELNYQESYQLKAYFVEYA